MTEQERFAEIAKALESVNSGLLEVQRLLIDHDIFPTSFNELFYATGYIEGLCSQAKKGV